MSLYEYQVLLHACCAQVHASIPGMCNANAAQCCHLAVAQSRQPRGPHTTTSPTSLHMCSCTAAPCQPTHCSPRCSTLGAGPTPLHSHAAMQSTCASVCCWFPVSLLLWWVDKGGGAAVIWHCFVLLQTGHGSRTQHRAAQNWLLMVLTSSLCLLTIQTATMPCFYLTNSSIVPPYQTDSKHGSSKQHRSVL